MGLLARARTLLVDFLTGYKSDKVTVVDPYEHSVPLNPVISEKGMAMRAEEVTKPDIPKPPERKPLKGSLQDRLQKARK